MRRPVISPLLWRAYKKLKADGYYNKYPYQEVGIKQLTRREPTKISRGLRLGLLYSDPQHYQ